MSVVIVKDKHALLLQVQDPERYIKSVAHAAPLSWKGQTWVQMPHNEEALSQLRSLGVTIDAPSPYDVYYEPPRIKRMYAPRDDQHEVARFIARERRCFVLNPPRMGKTSSTLMAFDYIRRRGTRRLKALVVAPLPTVNEVWIPEIYLTFDDIRAAPLVGSKQKRLDTLKQDLDLFVINPDGVKVIDTKLLEMARDGVFSMLIIDEITEYGNPSTARWKALNPIARAIEAHNGYIVGLTGTPGGPELVYGQVKMVRPAQVPTSVNAWRQETMFPTPISIPKNGRVTTVTKWKPRIDADKHIRRVLQPSIRFEKSVLGLAQLLEVQRKSEMSDQQKAMFKSLKNSMKVATEGGQMITAQNAAVMFGKLVQVALGAVYDDDGTVTRLDCTPRLDSLDEEIAKSESKVVIFTPFRHIMTLLEEHLKHSVRVDGGVTGKARTAAFERWRADTGPQCLILHPRTGAYGLELAIADTLIMYGPPLTSEFIYSQMKERINSPVQKSLTPTIVELSASDLEVARFSDLRNNVAYNDGVIKHMTKLLQE